MRSTILQNNGFEYIADVQRLEAPDSTYAFNIFSRWEQAKSPTAERRVLQLNLDRRAVERLRGLLTVVLQDPGPCPDWVTVYDSTASKHRGIVEHWVEDLQPIRSRGWRLHVTPMGALGAEPGETTVERFASNTAMIKFMAERDAENDAGESVGPRLLAIEAYARSAGRADVLKIINRERNGVRVCNPRIIAVTGTTTIGSFPTGSTSRRTFITLQTSRGPAIMAIPDPSSTQVTCWIGGHPYHQGQWTARLTPRLRAELQGVLEASPSAVRSAGIASAAPERKGAGEADPR